MGVAQLTQVILSFFPYLLVYGFASGYATNEHRWKYYAVCRCEKYREEAHFKSRAILSVDCCPKCGLEAEAFPIKKMRWNNKKIKFFKPWTWDKGFWEEKEYKLLSGD